MISELLPQALVGGGALSLLMLARWTWRVQAIASLARTFALVLVLLAAGAVAGVVDLARLLALIRAAANVGAGVL